MHDFGKHSQHSHPISSRPETADDAIYIHCDCRGGRSRYPCTAWWFRFTMFLNYVSDPLTFWWTTKNELQPTELITIGSPNTHLFTTAFSIPLRIVELVPLPVAIETNKNHSRTDMFIKRFCLYVLSQVFFTVLSTSAVVVLGTTNCQLQELLTARNPSIGWARQNAAPPKFHTSCRRRHFG